MANRELPELKGNQIINRPEKDEPKNKKIISGTAIVKKPSLGKKFASTFIEGDNKSVMEYMVWDVFIPATKEMIYNMVESGFKMLLFGEKRNPNIDRYQSTSYRSAYRPAASPLAPPVQTRTIGRSPILEEIIIPNKVDAENVLDTLLSILEEYQVVRVADLYELVGRETDSTFTQSYGWDNLASSSVERVHGGYLINLPRPIQIRRGR